MTIETDALTTWIGRCPEKGCRHRVRLDLGRFVEIDGQQIGSVYYLKHMGQERNELCCPEHWQILKFKGLKATYRAEVRCDAKCSDAVSFDCKCSCGGANHGTTSR